jgi:hypothetical protein
MSKYLVITSQYYHSRFSFVCEFNPETFRQQAISCIEELEKYKRREDDDRSFNLGDFDEKYYKDECYQYNVNDSGDIYFEIVESINAAIYKCQYYWESSRSESVGYKSKVITEHICIHHEKYKTRRIIENHFKIL